MIKKFFFNKKREDISKHLKNSDFVLSISHSDYKNTIGGTEKFISMEEDSLCKVNISYVHFYFISKDKINITIDSLQIGTFDLKDFILLINDLTDKSNFTLRGFHIHHLLTAPMNKIGIIFKTLSIPFICFFLHDYYSICPQHNLLFNNFVPCSYDQNWCQYCSTKKKKTVHVNQLNKAIFPYISLFIAPSECTKNIFLNAYPAFDNKTIVIPHQKISEKKYLPRQISKQNYNKKIKIAYVGYEAEHKGWSQWKKLIRTLNNDDYEFFHIGYSGEKLPAVINVTTSFVSEGYDSTEVKLKDLKIDVVFLWSKCPETFSFVFFECLSSGCFVVTNNKSGNICDQVNKIGCGKVFTSFHEATSFLNNTSSVKKSIQTYQENFLKKPLSLKPNTKISNMIYKESGI